MPLILFLAGVLGGTLNAVAGGASFVTFPAMVFAGVTPIVANASSAVALWPASLASSWVYRRDIPRRGHTLLAFSIVSLVGGAIGSLLLLVTNDTTFSKILPFLMLVAAVVFTFGKRVARLAGGKQMALGPACILQLFIAIYGGYFGGGMGILMLAVYTLMGMTDMHAMNGLKAFLGAVLNGVAIVLFFYAKKVDMTAAVPMLLGSIVGGFGGASLARRVKSEHVRLFALVIAWGMTAYFFYRSFIVRL